MKQIILIFIVFCSILKIEAQDSIDAILPLFDDAYELELKQPDSALILYDYIITQAVLNKKTLYEAKAKSYKGIVFSDMGKYDSAITNYNASLNVFKKIKNDKGIAANLINLGNAYKLKGDLTTSILKYQNGIKVYEALKNDKNLAISYGNLATIFEDIGDYNNAKMYYFKSLKYATATNDSLQLTLNYYNLSVLYGNQEKVDSMGVCLDKAKKYFNNSSNVLVQNLMAHGEARYLFMANKTTEALVKANEALKYQLEYNDPYYLSLNYNLIASINLDLGKKEAALKAALKSVKIAEEINSEPNLIKNYKILSQVYSSQKNYERAYYYSGLKEILKEKVVNENLRYRFNLLNIKYKTEKKDKEIANQQLEIKNKEAEIEKKQTQNIIAIGSAIFLLIAAILIVFIFKQRQKRIKEEVVSLKRQHQIKTLEALIEGEENERFRIARELHDGVNGDLSAIKYKLSSLLEMNNKIINEAITMIDDSCKQVRAISHDLVPPSLESFNLIEATEAYCSNLNEAHPEIDIAFQHMGEEVSLSKKNEINIFRIIQELVSNSLKHAQAKAVNVQISHRNHQIQITVEDDGVGFNANEVISKGIGLSNVKSRVDYLNATLDLISNQSGTSYTIDIDTTQLDGN